MWRAIADWCCATEENILTKSIQAVVFDWAGTMIDFGCFAPTIAFVDVFAEFGIDVSLDDARGPMGLPKRDHISSMLTLTPVRQKWTETFGREPGPRDVDALYQRFIPLNEHIVAKHSKLIPGAIETVSFLNSYDVQIGSTTGYTRSIMRHVLPAATAQGYVPQNCVCSDDVDFGRPGPEAMFKCMQDLGIQEPSTMLKVDDTAPGIAEGVAAGCVTVGLALSGNHVGLTVQELSRLPTQEVVALRQSATDMLLAAGADYVIDSVADLPSLMARSNMINAPAERL